MRSLAMQGLGYTFLLLGVLGLFLPILQGILFLVIGLVILSRYAPWAERLLQRFEARHPRIGQLREEAEARLAIWGRKIVGLFGR